MMSSTASAAAPRSTPIPLIVDGHVHFYGCHSLARFLDAAVDNLRRIGAAACHGRSDALPCLLMTESARDDAFARLSSGRMALPPGWTMLRQPCRASLHLARDGGGELRIIAGRQVATAERLEVLSIGSDTSVADGRPIAETISRVREAGAFPVIPWGFGKWWGRRGQIVRSVLEHESPELLSIGDNGGRLAAGPEPAIFRLGERLGYRVFPGSDPLPFPGQEARVGSYGFLLDVACVGNPVASDITKALTGVPASPARLGHRTGPLAFANAQVRMQLKTRP